MNIFYLHEIPRVAAQMHCDSHVIKMIVESAQMLSTAHRILDHDYEKTYYNHGKIKRNYFFEIEKLQRNDYEDKDGNIIKHHDIINKQCYLSTHPNHPCNKWIRVSKMHYYWVFNLFKELLEEYKYRNGKIHKTSKYLPFLQRTPINLSGYSFTNPPRAFGDMCLSIRDKNIVDAYRKYYASKKEFINKYTIRDKPEWLTELQNLREDEPSLSL